MFLGVCIITNVSRPKIDDILINTAFGYTGKFYTFCIKKDTNVFVGIYPLPVRRSRSAGKCQQE